MKQIKAFFFIFVVTIFCNVYPYKSVVLAERQQCDLELILNDGFNPLTGFMNQNDYDSVVETMRLCDGTVWPMPITLDVGDDVIDEITINDTIGLHTREGKLLAMMHVQDKWVPDKEKEAQMVFGTTSVEHPGVSYLFNKTGRWYVGGIVTLVALPKRYDFFELRLTPAELKRMFAENGYEKIVAFQTRNPMHRAHVELTMQAMKDHDAHLLLHPVVGMTKPGDVDYVTRVRCYKKLLSHYPTGSVTLSLLPIAMRMAGPREALWHAKIRKNYGCTHFIVGRDHAGPGSNSQGEPFYGPYDAQNLVQQYEHEIGITMVPFKEMLYVPEEDAYFSVDAVPPGKETLSLSGTRLRELLRTGQEIPSWFSYPEVIEELRRQHPLPKGQGFTIFFTGLSGSGKSTLANALAVKLGEVQDRKVTLLDGDILRTYLSSELGFSKKHRSIHVKRTGFVASEITKHGGIALCALIAPYEEDRDHNRHLIGSHGGYIEVYVATPISVCEDRDVKGLYQKAREGLITGFTGIDDPYEEPQKPALVIDTSSIPVEQACDEIINYLAQEGYIDGIDMTRRGKRFARKVTRLNY